MRQGSFRLAIALLVGLVAVTSALALDWKGLREPLTLLQALTGKGATFNGDLNVNGDAGVSNNTRVGGTLNGVGAVDLDSTLSVDGTGVFGGLLSAATVDAGTVASRAASGSISFSAATGGRWKYGAGTTDYCISNGSTTVNCVGDFTVDGTATASIYRPVGTTAMHLDSHIAANSTAFLLDATNDHTSGNIVCVRDQAGSVQVGCITYNGGYAGAGEIISGTLISSPVLDGGAIIGTTVNTSGNTVLGGELSVASTATFTGNIVANGGVNLGTGAGLIFDGKCDSTGSPGNAVCNQFAGRAAIAAAASAITITNSKAQTDSIPVAILQASDGTCTSVLRCVPASGSFTCTVNAACTGDTNIGWWLAD